MSEALWLTGRRPGGPSQNVAFTSTSASSAAIPPGAATLTIYCSVAAWVKVAVGTTQAVATASDIPVPANVPVVFPIPQRTANDANAASKVFAAAMSTTITTAGTMYVQPNAE